MRIPYYTKQFKKDALLAKKRGKDISKLKHLMALMAQAEPLPEKYKDHPLRGKFEHYRECHLEPDWLLIYKLIASEIHFTRTGTHSDLFG